MLLEAVLAAARVEGFRVAHGTLTKSDITRNPFLPSWYWRHGFELLDPDGESVGDPAFKLMYRFPAPSPP
jgi:hypothetical protein